ATAAVVLPLADGPPGPEPHRPAAGLRQRPRRPAGVAELRAVGGDGGLHPLHAGLPEPAAQGAPAQRAGLVVPAGAGHRLGGPGRRHGAGPADVRAAGRPGERQPLQRHAALSGPGRRECMNGKHSGPGRAGFTLIELLVVMALIVVLAVIGYVML